ncbi:TPA: hypothetical protein ACGXM6_003619 [Bacillus cereus]
MSKIKRYSRSPLIENLDKIELKQLKSPSPKNEIEIHTMMNLLTSVHPPIESITIGHGRDEASRDIAYAMAELWETKGGSEGAGGYVLNIVDWPEEAASWLRPATRLTDGEPDAWIVTGSLLGWIQMCRRLYKDTNWDAQRTFGFSPLANPLMFTYAGKTIEGQSILEGMRGILSNGDMWYIENGRFTISLNSNVTHK